MSESQRMQPIAQLEPHEVNRLLRAFSGDLTKPSVRFQIAVDESGATVVTCNHSGGHHEIKVNESEVVHTMRHGTCEVKTSLTLNPHRCSFGLKRQRRDFDFEKSELGAPVNVPIEHPMQVNQDIMHMLHVSHRITQSVANKTQGMQR